MTNYELLIHRLDAFIRKYYANKLVRGLLIFFSSLLAFWLVVSLGEYFLYFPTWLRYALLGVLIVAGGFALIAMIVVPLLQTQKLGRVISHEKAAQIIGVHFPNVSDKLLNVLQLGKSLNDAASKELIIASIEQRTKELQPVPFQKAINFSKNKRYLSFLLPLLLISLFILLAAPNIFKESAKRLLSPSVTYTPPAPFEFNLLTKKLSIPQYDDIEIEVSTKGTSIPEHVYLRYNGQEIMMQKKSKNLFSHTFFKVAKSIDFSFSASGVSSKTFTINTLHKPVIKNFKVWVDYPDYTGRKDEVLENIGDVIVPQGTTLRWSFNTEHTDQMFFAMGYGGVHMNKHFDNFSLSYRFMRDTSYAIIIANKQVEKRDTLQYSVSVIPDQYPSIHVQQYNDSLTEDFVLFVGEAGDDYGIRHVMLNYTIQPTDEAGRAVGASRSASKPLPIQAGTLTQFNYFLDINDLELRSGDKLSYYFTACDNDAVNGSKCAKSAVFNYEKPSLKKLDSIVEKTQEQVNKDLKNAAKQSDKIEKEIKQMQEKLLQKNELDWQDKKNLEDMMARNENLQKQIDEIKKKFEQNNKRTENKEMSDELKQKQENLEHLLDDLKKNELDERMKKMEELMNMLNKDKLFEQLKQMEQDNKMMEKDLDRIVELMKQFERDMRLEDLAKKAEQLAAKQDELNKKVDNKQISDQEAKKEQDKLNKEMEDFKKEMAEMEKVNEQMENKGNLDDIKKDQQDAENNMQKSSDELQSGQSSKASKSQKNAKNSLESMAQKMKQMAGAGSPDQIEEDIKSVRQTLSNLIRMSFGQEDLIEDTRKTSISDPKYVQQIQVQQKLKMDAKMIADSLFALSKRQPMLASTVNREIENVNKNMEQAISTLEGRNINQANVHQQYVMTGANNLALMLNELLKNLMDQQAQSSGNPSDGSCKKPGSKPGGKPGKKGGQGVGLQLGDIITKQEQLGNAMKQLMNRQGQKNGQGKDGKDGQKGEQGNKPGGQQGGGEGGEQPGGESEQMARIAAQQAALRKQLNDINNQLKKEGKSLPNLTKIQQEMDRNETDIVNKRLTNDILRRQSEIMTRLLESKEALREQDQGEQRESNTGKEQTKEIPPALKEILKNKQSVIDYYKTVPAELKPYYKKMVEDYYLLIK